MLLDWTNHHVPNKCAKQRVYQDWQRLKNYCDSDALANAGDGHWIADILIRPRDDQIVSLIQRKRSACSVANHEIGTRQTKCATANENK